MRKSQLNEKEHGKTVKQYSSPQATRQYLDFISTDNKQTPLLYWAEYICEKTDQLVCGIVFI